MQREEKQLDSLLEASLNRLNDLKVSIASMIHKMEVEHETICWPAFLDNFAIISGHLTGLSKTLASEMAPSLRNLTVLPLKLSQERDETLLQLTEGRIPLFSHDFVPDYLRTKPEPAAETRMALHEAKANALTNETALKQVAQYSKVVSHVFDLVSKAREEWEIEVSSRGGMNQTSSLADTHTLVAAVGLGKNLKGGMVPMIPRPGPGGVQMSSVSPGVSGPQIGKLPSSIKTNIKSASQLHPYLK